MNALMNVGQSYFFFAVVLILSGCGTVYVNEADQNLDAAERDSFTVERSVDGAYREVFGRLQECVSVYGYRVRGNINRERDAADITVDSGVGFERVLYLADSLYLKAELQRLAPQRTRVTFIVQDPAAKPFADGTKHWLVSGEGPCRA